MFFLTGIENVWQVKCISVKHIFYVFLYTAKYLRIIFNFSKSLFYIVSVKDIHFQQQLLKAMIQCRENNLKMNVNSKEIFPVVYAFRY